MFCYARSIFRLFVPRRKDSVEGEVCLVTGAGSGIGRQLALQMARLGAIIVCLDVNEESNNETVRLVTESTERGSRVAFGYQCDVSDSAHVESVAKQILCEVGDVNIIFNNAGVRTVRPFVQYTTEQIERMIKVNLMGKAGMKKIQSGTEHTINFYNFRPGNYDDLLLSTPNLQFFA